MWDCGLLALATFLEKFDHDPHRGDELSEVGEEREDLMKLVHVNSGERRLRTFQDSSRPSK